MPDTRLISIGTIQEKKTNAAVRLDDDKSSIAATQADLNAEFKKATPQQKRVMIAKDVIATINTKKITIDTGSFISIFVPAFQHAEEEDEEAIKLVNIPVDAKVNDLLSNNKQVSCDCCAVGAAVLSCMRLTDMPVAKGFNEKKLVPALIDNYGTLDLEGEDAFRILRKFFSKKQVNMIEWCFETSSGWVGNQQYESTSYYDNNEDYQRALAFGKKYRSSEKRLLAIMDNIIANNGTFNP